MVLIFLVTFIFATLAYYIEEDKDVDDKTFTSVFDAIYWGTITISTVGRCIVICLVMLSA